VTYFAGRYKGVPSEKLSFNLVNEPIVTPAPAQMEALKKAGKLKPEDFFNGQFARSHAADYTRVARAAIEAITKHDPQRLVVTDGTTAARLRSRLYSTPRSCRVAIPTIQYS